VAADWPQFRGPNGDGLSTAKGVPTTWAEGENIAWKTAIHGKGWSSPVTAGDRIWLTTADETGDGKTVSHVKFFAVALDRKTGKVVHDVKLFEEDKPAFCHPFNSYASPTPVLDGDRVYIHFGSHGTACLNAKTAEKIWVRTDLKCNHFRGPGSSPIIWNDVLILTFDGFDFQYVTGLEKATGKTLWKTDRNIKYKNDNGDYKKAYSTPQVIAVNGQPQLVSPAAEQTIAYNPKTGSELWRVSHGGMNESIRPVLTHDLIILNSGHTSNLVAVKTGKSGDITSDGIAWRYDKKAPTRPSVLAIKDHLFMVSDNGIATCLEAKTGKFVWEERLDGQFSASPVFVDGHIYAPNEQGKTHVFAADPTKFVGVAVNKLDAGCMASPAIDEGRLYLRTKTHLYAIGK
jgi:outer membrane protein assembly factor BamB